MIVEVFVAVLAALLVRDALRVWSRHATYPWSGSSRKAKLKYRTRRMLHG